ncbi:MAG: (2Fe-2S)-binding protein [Nitrospinota bacterium]|nr:MAG: (2Fe-2S)-binding protein [Nitrospinota bacterium]
MEQQRIQLQVNGKPETLFVYPNELLLNVLREHLHLTGTKYACGVGECGACTVLLDGKPVLSCLTLAITADGCAITTIEGIAPSPDRLDPVQEAFLDQGATQCGYCTPGFILISKALLAENSDPGEAEIREYLRGNLCRCTGYLGIIRAVKAAASRMRQGGTAQA